jgi:hypothetical protein
LKDICYEVKTGFLPNKAIVEMICDIDSDCDSNDIGKNRSTRRKPPTCRK